MIHYLLTLFIWSSLAHSLPAKYDLRQKNGVTPAKKQAWGTCWAHATIASIESNLIFKKNKILNLSSYHMDKFNGFNRNGQKGYKQNGWYSGQGSNYIGSNSDAANSGVIVHLGGDFRMALAYIMNNGGVVNELPSMKISHLNIDHKKFGYNNSQGIKLKSKEYSYYLPQDVEFLSLAYKNNLKYQIKKNILKYGAISTSQYLVEKPLTLKNNLELHGYFGKKKINHAINIIGWDDNLLYKGRKGAWIIKDSDHKDEKTGKHIGYFYVLYDDSLVTHSPFMGAVLFRNTIQVHFKNIYSHSLHGWRYTTNNNIIKLIANRYISKSKENITGIGIINPYLNAKYKVYFSQKLEKKSFQLLRQGKLHNPGFHYLKIKSLHLKKNKQFFIILKFDKPQYPYDASFTMDIALNKSLPNWNQPINVNSHANINESFYYNGHKWIDFYSYKSKTNKQINNQHSTNNHTANFVLNVYTR